MDFDQTKSAARLGALYLGADVVRQRARTLELLAPEPGDAVLDLGCGPGLLTVELAERLGERGQVTAVDASKPMVEATVQQAETAGLGQRISTIVADAASLPSDDASFDRAVAVQVMEYVPDVERALAELHRVLRPGGRLLVVDTDWRSCVWASADRDRTDQVLRAWESHFVHPHLPAWLGACLEAAGFEDVTVDVIPIINREPGPDAFSRGMAKLMWKWLARQEKLPAASLEAWYEDVLSHEPYFFSVCRFALRATRSL